MDEAHPGELRAAGTDPGDLQKPPYTYVALITMAIRDSPEQRLSLSDTCTYIAERFPYYRGEQRGEQRGERHGWEKIVSHNLSTNPCFQRLPRRGSIGSDWALVPDLLHNLPDCDPPGRLPDCPPFPQPPLAVPAPALLPAVYAPYAVSWSLPPLLMLLPTYPQESWTAQERPVWSPAGWLNAAGLMPCELCTRAAPDFQ